MGLSRYIKFALLSLKKLYDLFIEIHIKYSSVEHLNVACPNE